MSNLQKKGLLLLSYVAVSALIGCGGEAIPADSTESQERALIEFDSGEYNVTTGESRLTKCLNAAQDNYRQAVEYAGERLSKCLDEKYANCQRLEALGQTCDLQAGYNACYAEYDKRIGDANTTHMNDTIRCQRYAGIQE